MKIIYTNIHKQENSDSYRVKTEKFFLFSNMKTGWILFKKTTQKTCIL